MNLTMEQLQDRARSGDHEAQYQLGRLLAAHHDWTRARRFLREAAEAGHAGALTELAVFHLHGIAIPPDMSVALDLLMRAERAGSGEAAYTLALIAWSDKDVPTDLPRMAERVRTAALRDYAPALRAMALMYTRQGETAASQACLTRAAAHGDGPAAYLLARRAQLDGNVVQALALARIAIARGAARAQRLLTLLPEVDVAPPQLQAPLPQSLPAVQLQAYAPSVREVHCADPLVETIDNVLSSEECEYIIALGDGQLEKSVTLDDQKFKLTRNEYRTSSDHSFYTFQEDFGLRWLQWRMTTLVGAPLSHAEHLVLLRYIPGEEYKPHRDYLPPSAPGVSANPDQPGQRVHTVFCYLTDVESGGETDFPLLDVRVQPKQGRVVHFHNLHANGMPDDRTLHAGMPVIAGTKWLATLWTRERRMRSY
jgi:hypothetical protein